MPYLVIGQGLQQRQSIRICQGSWFDICGWWGQRLNLALHFAAAYNKIQRYCEVVCGSGPGSTTLILLDLDFKISYFLSNRGPFVWPHSFVRLFTVEVMFQALALAHLVSLPPLSLLPLPLYSCPSPLLSSLTFAPVFPLLFPPQPANSFSWDSSYRNAQQTYRYSQCSTWAN